MKKDSEDHNALQKQENIKYARTIFYRTTYQEKNNPPREIATDIVHLKEKNEFRKLKNIVTQLMKLKRL